MRSRFFDFAHVLFGKPVPTFPEHALAPRDDHVGRPDRRVLRPERGKAAAGHRRHLLHDGPREELDRPGRQSLPDTSDDDARVEEASAPALERSFQEIPVETRWSFSCAPRKLLTALDEQEERGVKISATTDMPPGPLLLLVSLPDSSFLGDDNQFPGGINGDHFRHYGDAPWSGSEWKDGWWPFSRPT